MTQEEKQLLLIDLCARLPYGTKVQRINSFYKWRKEVDDLSDVFLSYNSLVQFKNHIEHLEIKPYLRPMSSMTEEELKEERRLWNVITNTRNDLHYIYTDFLLSHHFDYRGLIEKGLALEATENMYKVD